MLPSDITGFLGHLTNDPTYTTETGAPNLPDPDLSQLIPSSAQTSEDKTYAGLDTPIDWTGDYAYNSAEAEKNRQFQHDEAELERQWQERMSNSAYQRQVADLKAAGLNPVLAATNFGGASSAAGASAAGSQASSGSNATFLASLVKSLGSVVGSAVSAALKAK